MIIELNTNESNALLQLIDMAVKSGGLGVAQAALVLSTKIQQAQSQSPTSESQVIPLQKQEA